MIWDLNKSCVWNKVRSNKCTYNFFLKSLIWMILKYWMNLRHLNNLCIKWLIRIIQRLLKNDLMNCLWQVACLITIYSHKGLLWFAFMKTLLCLLYIRSRSALPVSFSKIFDRLIGCFLYIVNLWLQMSFTGVGDLQTAFEKKTRREKMSQQRKEELAKFRQMLCAVSKIKSIFLCKFLKILYY